MLRQWAIDNNITDREVLKERFEQCVEKLDPAKTVIQIQNQRFNRFVASIRDKHGLRMAFPVKGKDGNCQIHIIPGSPSLDATAQIESRLAHNSQGNSKTRKPVAEWKEILIRQMSLNFGEKNE